MDITRDNFVEKLPAILEQLGKADFIAFDLEMTGINNVDRSKGNRKDDLPGNRYMKMVDVATKYNIIQVGMSMFTLKKGKSTNSAPS